MKGTEGAGSPFFSPDGAWIGFWADGKIKKVRADGGPIIDVCATSPTGDDQPARSDPSMSGEIVGASWGSDDTIVFALPLGGLWQVAARGGVPAPLTTLGADEISHRLPHVLPGGHGVLFTVIRRAFYWDNVSTDVRVTATGERKQLVPKAVDARYLESGHLVYARDGVLLAQSFDATRFEVSGSPVGVLDNVMHAIGAGSSTLDTGAAQVAISRTGTLAYVRGGPYPAHQKAARLGGRPGTRVSSRSTATRVPRAASVARRQADRVHVAPFAGSRRVGRRAARRPELAHDVRGA